MPRGAAEVADVFRCYGDAYRQPHSCSLSTAQRRVMTAIEQCRTAALVGHVEQCDACGHQRIWYNSCLMGKFRNGEFVHDRLGATRSSGGRALHYDLSRSRAMSLSGARKEPLRRCGGTIASMASSFS